MYRSTYGIYHYLFSGQEFTETYWETSGNGHCLVITKALGEEVVEEVRYGWQNVPCSDHHKVLCKIGNNSSCQNIVKFCHFSHFT